MSARDAKPGTSLDRPAPPSDEEKKALLEEVNQAHATIKKAKTVLSLVLSRTDDVDNELANQVKESFQKVNAATGAAAQPRPSLCPA